MTEHCCVSLSIYGGDSGSSRAANALHCAGVEGVPCSQGLSVKAESLAVGCFSAHPEVLFKAQHSREICPGLGQGFSSTKNCHRHLILSTTHGEQQGGSL